MILINRIKFIIRLLNCIGEVYCNTHHAHMRTVGVITHRSKFTFISFVHRSSFIVLRFVSLSEFSVFLCLSRVLFSSSCGHLASHSVGHEARLFGCSVETPPYTGRPCQGRERERERERECMCAVPPCGVWYVSVAHSFSLSHSFLV